MIMMWISQMNWQLYKHKTPTELRAGNDFYKTTQSSAFRKQVSFDVNFGIASQFQKQTW